MSDATPTITLVPGTPRIGIWCDDCLTSGRYEVDLWAFGLGMPQVISTIKRCDRCDGDERHELDDVAREFGVDLDTGDE